MQELPNFSEALVKELDQSIPAKCPVRGESLESIHRYAGQRELVESLLARLQLTSDQGKVI